MSYLFLYFLDKFIVESSSQDVIYEETENKTTTLSYTVSKRPGSPLKARCTPTPLFAELAQESKLKLADSSRKSGDSSAD